MRLARTIVAVAVMLIAPMAFAVELEVHAAVSLTEVLTEIGAMYGRVSGDVVRFNFGASSFLARQIEDGAGGDIFFSADEEKMNTLMRHGLIRPETRQAVLTNALVVVVPRNSQQRLAAPRDLRRFTRIAIGEPQSVPAGIYARLYLERSGLWKTLEPKLIPTESVRAALAAVESENADAGIVYRTDARIVHDVRIALTLDGTGAPEIIYPVAVLADSHQPRAALQFVHYLRGREAAAVFRRHGFGMR